MTTKPVSYQDIFDDISFQDADDSRSVLSPAAYLADLLFLKDDIGQDDAIDNRRPDIKKDILLNRENTYETVPYLSIANRVMTNYLHTEYTHKHSHEHKDTGKVHTHTHSHNGDLNVHDHDHSTGLDNNPPEVNDMMQFSPYPFNVPYALPFNEATEVARKGVETRDTTTHELYMKLAKDPNCTIAARELLKLSQEKLSLIAYDCGPGSSNFDTMGHQAYETYVKKMWGMKDRDTFADLSDLKTFLEHAMMSEKELKSILHQNCSKSELNQLNPIPANNDFGGFFINNGEAGDFTEVIDEQNSYAVVDEEGVSTSIIVETGRTSGTKQSGDWLDINYETNTDKEDTLCITNRVSGTKYSPTADYFDRFHRFVRLAKALEWSYIDLDTVLMAVCGGKLNEHTIAYVAAINELHKATKKPIVEICALFNTIKNYGDGAGAEPAHLLYSLFNTVRDDISELPDGDELKLYLMASLKINREMLDFAWDTTIKTAASKSEGLNRLFRFVTIAEMLRCNVKETALLLSIIEESKEFFTERHTFAIDVPFAKPEDGDLLQTILTADSSKTSKIFWTVQTALAVVARMKELHISMEQLNFMMHGISGDETVAGVFTQEQIKALIKQWHELFASLLCNEYSFESDLVSKTQSQALFTHFVNRGIITAEGLILQKLTTALTTDACSAIGITPDATNLEQWEKEYGRLTDYINDMAFKQEEAFYLTLQNQFGMSHNIIKAVAVNVCKNPTETEKDLLNNLVSPVMTFMTSDDEIEKADALNAINDFYTIIQQYLMMIGKVDLSEREVEALFNVLVLNDVTIKEEYKLPALDQTKIDTILANLTSPLLNPIYTTVFVAPNNNIIAIKPSGYDVYNSSFTKLGERIDYTQFTIDTTISGLPVNCILPIKASANVSASELVLFDSANNSWLWKSGTWNPGNFSHIDNPLALSGNVDAAYADETGFYIFSAGYIYKYENAKDDAHIAPGFPQKVIESDLLKGMFDATNPEGDVKAAYKVGSALHLHIDNAENTFLIGEAGIDGTYSLTTKTNTKDTMGKVECFLTDGGSVVSAFIGTLSDGVSALYVFVKQGEHYQYYRYTNPTSAFQAGSHCDEGYPKRFSPTSENPFTPIFEENKAPFKLSSAVTVDEASGTPKTYLFADDEFVCSDDMADRNPIGELWKAESGSSTITTMSAGFVSDHGWTYIIAKDASDVSHTYRYNSDDYASIYDDTALQTSLFWPNLPATAEVDAAFMLPQNSSVGMSNQSAAILFTEGGVKKYALYTMGADGSVLFQKIGLFGEFENEGAGTPSLQKDSVDLNVIAAYTEEVNGYPTFHIFHRTATNEIKEIVHEVKSSSTGIVTEKDVDSTLASVISIDNLTAVIKGLDTLYYFSATHFTFPSYDEDGVLGYANSTQNGSFWGKRGISNAVRNFKKVKTCFSNGSDIYFVSDTDFIKASYDKTGDYDGFIVETGYPKARSEFLAEATGITIAGNSEVTNITNGHVTFTDVEVNQQFTKTVGQTVQSGSVATMGTTRNVLKDAITPHINWAFSYNDISYLFVDDQYYRYSSMDGVGTENFYVDEGYPKQFTVESFNSNESIGFPENSVKCLPSKQLNMTAVFDDPNTNRTIWGTLHGDYTPSDIKSAIYDDGTLYMFGDNLIVTSSNLGTSNADSGSLVDLSAEWRTAGLASAPKLFDGGCQWAIPLNGEMHYAKEYLQYREGNDSLVAIPVVGGIVQADCTAFEEITPEHKERSIYYKEVVLREIETKGGIHYQAKPVAAMYNGFPAVSEINSVYKVNGVLYYISGDEYVRVDADWRVWPLAELWRLRDDFEGITLVDIDTCKKFKDLSSQFDKRDNSILTYLQGKSRSATELNRITGWYEGDSGKDIESKLYDAPIDNAKLVQSLYKISDAYYYAERFNVSPRQLWDKVWNQLLFSDDHTSFGNYYDSSSNLRKPLLYGELPAGVDNSSRESGARAVSEMVQSTFARVEREEYVKDFDRALNSQKRDALVGLSLVKRNSDNYEKRAPLIAELQNLSFNYGHATTDEAREAIQKEIDAVKVKLQKYPRYSTTRDLYGYLLTDVMMSEDTEVSQIKEAILSMQLYYHRFLMGLEEEADELSSDGTSNPEETGEFEGELKQWWEWMKNYRVWEANRKVFIYPENYIRPELRSDKSPEFKKLESAILENDISDENVTTAYKEYLNGFSTVSKLNVVGGFVHTIDDEGEDKGKKKSVMFGRTNQEPFEYYYATGEIVEKNNTEEPYDLSWDAWDKLNVQINSDIVYPVFAFNRMFVFWVEYHIGEKNILDHNGNLTTGDSENLSEEKSWVPNEPNIYCSYYDLNKQWSVPHKLVNIYKRHNSPYDEKSSEYFGELGKTSLNVNIDNNSGNIILRVQARKPNSGITWRVVYSLTDSLELKMANNPLFTYDDSLEHITSDVISPGASSLQKWETYPYDERNLPWYSFSGNGGSFVSVPTDVFLEKEKITGEKDNIAINSAFQDGDELMVFTKSSLDNSNTSKLIKLKEYVSTETDNVVDVYTTFKDGLKKGSFSAEDENAIEIYDLTQPSDALPESCDVKDIIWFLQHPMFSDKTNINGAFCHGKKIKIIRDGDYVVSYNDNNLNVPIEEFPYQKFTAIDDLPADASSWIEYSIDEDGSGGLYNYYPFNTQNVLRYKDEFTFVSPAKSYKLGSNLSSDEYHSKLSQEIPEPIQTACVLRFNEILAEHQDNSWDEWYLYKIKSGQSWDDYWNKGVKLINTSKFPETYGTLVTPEGVREIAYSIYLAEFSRVPNIISMSVPDSVFLSDTNDYAQQWLLEATYESFYPGGTFDSDCWINGIPQKGITSISFRNKALDIWYEKRDECREYLGSDGIDAIFVLGERLIVIAGERFVFFDKSHMVWSKYDYYNLEPNNPIHENKITDFDNRFKSISDGFLLSDGTGTVHMFGKENGTDNTICTIFPLIGVPQKWLLKERFGEFLSRPAGSASVIIDNDLLIFSSKYVQKFSKNTGKWEINGDSTLASEMFDFDANKTISAAYYGLFDADMDADMNSTPQNEPRLLLFRGKNMFRDYRPGDNPDEPAWVCDNDWKNIEDEWADLSLGDNHVCATVFHVKSNKDGIETSHLFFISHEVSSSENEIIEYVGLHSYPFLKKFLEYDIFRLTTNTATVLEKALFSGGFGNLLTLSTQDKTEELPKFSNQKGGDDTIYINPKYFNRIPNAVINNGSITSTQSGLDFKGALSLYYREIFFHIPYLIANRLNLQQRFEDAKKWYEFIFNPIKADINSANYWIYSEFFKDQDDWNTSNKELDYLHKEASQLSAYYNAPFDPHAIASIRPVAYRKSFVMAYIDNIIDWGDNLFREYTHESINEARMLYVLASDLLGEKPISTGEMELSEDRTFQDYIGASRDSKALRGVWKFENAPLNSYGYDIDYTTLSLDTPNDSLIVGDYFYMPENRQFIEYWDRIEDRLNNIRSGRNIDGVKVPLPLFQPPIDPMALVNAKANGLSLSQALSSLNISIPHYRYNFMASKAKELASRLNSLGNSLLSALEKKDGEDLALLRNHHERKLLEISQEIREAQLNDRKLAKVILGKNKDTIVARRDHYNNLVEDNLSIWEYAELGSMVAAQVMRSIATASVKVAAPLAAAPEANVGFPCNSVTYGPPKLADAAEKVAQGFQVDADLFNFASSMSSVAGRHHRREQEWQFQLALAEKELDSIDEQIKGAEIQIEIAKKEIRQAELQRKHNESVDLFMTSKFTNKELYQWMSSKLSGLFYQTYQMALDLAKQAQQSFRFELGLKEDEVNYLTSYYWDSQKKGLLAGEVLMSDLDRMDKGYMEKNSRRFEISKSVSLLDIDPKAVLDLKSEKTCNFTLSEKLFALDFPSHYGRQIKSISVTIPAVVGPYQNVNASLTQQSHYTLLDPQIESFKYLYGIEGATPVEGSIRSDWRGQQQIAVSRGVNDSGMFQLNFNDERYLPFEGTGAFSTWQLELTGHNGSFDLNTISDVIINVEYTALQGGEQFGSDVISVLTDANETYTEKKFFDVPQHFSTEWHAFKENPVAGLQVVLTSEMFPGLETQAGEAWGTLSVYNLTTNEYNEQPLSGDLSNGVMVSLGNVQGDSLVFIVEYEMKYQF